MPVAVYIYRYVIVHYHIITINNNIAVRERDNIILYTIIIIMNKLLIMRLKK